MTKEQMQAIASLRVIEAVYEEDAENGGFATVVDMGTDTPLRLENCRAEYVLEILAGLEGRALRVLKHNRCQATGCPYKHMDYLNISPSRLFMAVPYRKPVNTNHSRNAYLNNSRVLAAESGEQGKSRVRFLSGKVLPVKLSLKRLQQKIDGGRRLLYDSILAAKTELKSLDMTLRRLQRKGREGR